MKRNFKIGDKKYSFEVGCNQPQEKRFCDNDCGNCEHCTATMQGGDMSDIINLLIKNGLAELTF